jgi:hypothetical protein
MVVVSLQLIISLNKAVNPGITTVCYLNKKTGVQAASKFLLHTYTGGQAGRQNKTHFPGKWMKYRRSY